MFRHYYGAPPEGRGQAAATRGVVRTVRAMVDEGATHLGVATDHVIESFRNDLWPGYKTGAGVPEDLLAQFPLLEEALVELGVAVWAMVDLEADDALAAAASQLAEKPEVDQVAIWTPDKDLAQSVRGTRVVQVHRRTNQIVDEDAVRARYGVGPESIPDWLALVGDSADGYPGLPGWGKKSASVVLGRYAHLEDVPESSAEWDLRVTGAARLAACLADQRELALLFRDLATLRTHDPVIDDVEVLRWQGHH